MKKLFSVIFVLLMLIAGCASYSQIMINSTGEWQRCYSYGYGIMGIATADSIQNDCIKSLRSAGYIEIEKAGVIGAILSNEDTPIIIKIKEGSPADISGLKVGDKIINIDGQKVSNTKDAKILFFGLTDTQIEVTINRTGIETTFKMTRAPFTKIYGMPTETKTKKNSSVE